jgi:nucleoside-diphosphate-sugar epimerase
MNETPIALVTGASGKIGMNLIKHLLNQEWTVIAISSRPATINHEKLTWIQKSWDNISEIILPSIDVVYHLAGQNNAYIAQKNVIQDIKSNLILTINLLEVLKKHSIKPLFITLGSATEYGSHNKDELTENSSVTPETFYEVAKIASRNYIEQYEREGIIRKSISFRITNIYGMSKSLGDNDRGFIDDAIYRSMHNLDISCFGSGDFLRDYLHINDLMDALVTSYLMESNLRSNIYNLSFGESHTVIQVLEKILTLAQGKKNSNSRIVKVDFPTNKYEIEKRNAKVSSRKFREESNWKPNLNLVNGLDLSLSQYLVKHNNE